MNDTDLILGKIDELKNEINDMGTNVALLGASVNALVCQSNENKSAISKINTELHGTNGDKGLFPRVGMVENWMNTRTFYERAIILLLVGELVGLIFTLIQIL